MPGGFDQVLMIGWEYPPHNSGGLGVACEGLTQALAQQNTQIYFTLPYQHPTQLGHMNVVPCWDESWQTSTFGGPPFSVYYQPQVTPVAKPVDADALHALPQSELEQRVEMYAEAVAERTKPIMSQVGVIHAHDWMSFPAATELKKQTGKPMIAHVHSTEHDRIPTGFGSQYIMQTEAEGVKVADKVVAVSYYTKQLLVSKYGIDQSKIEVIHNGIEPLQTALTTETFASGQPVIVFMGRLTMQKGAEYFLQLAQAVLAKRPDALFVVAGHGDLYHELLFKTAYDRLTASVLFSGFVRGTQRDRLLNRADIFVMPSLSEPFGLVALEAAQRHTPVIVSKQAGVSEVLQSAIAVDFWDIDKMTRTILELLSNKAQAKQVVSGQLKELEKITWDHAAEKMKKLYRQAFLGS